MHQTVSPLLTSLNAGGRYDWWCQSRTDANERLSGFMVGRNVAQL
jgi:hypothetical protein